MAHSWPPSCSEREIDEAPPFPSWILKIPWGVWGRFPPLDGWTTEAKGIFALLKIQVSVFKVSG